MKKKLLPLTAGLVLASTATLLAGCGGGGNGPQEKFEISISARQLSSEQSMLELWATEYMKLNPKVKVSVDGWGSEDGTSENYIAANALNREDLTNIIYTTDDTTANLAQLKNFVDLRKYYEASPDTDYTKYYESMLNLTSFSDEFKPTTSYTGPCTKDKSDDPQYGVYFAPREYNMPGILCNVSLFKEYMATSAEKANWNKDSLKNLLLRLGGKQTWDWDCFVSALKVISDKINEIGKGDTLGWRAIELNQTWEPVYYTILMELGENDGLFVIDDNTGETKCNLKSTKNKAAYNKLVADFGKTSGHKFMVDTDYGNANFSKRNIFMNVCSYPEVGNYYEAYKRNNIELGFINFPTQKVAAGCGGYAIMKNESNYTQELVTGETANTTDLCWDFIKYIISKEGQNLCGKEGYIQPVLKELATTGDWLQSFDPNLDHTAFCTGEELNLNAFTFAAPNKRAQLRQKTSEFVRKLFEPTMENYDTDLNKAYNEINTILA